MPGMDRKKVLFIDRDGVIVKERQVDTYESIEYIPHVFEALREISKRTDFSLVMVSNQDGVGTRSFTYEGNVVPNVNYRAFENCTSIETLVIPESVTSVGSQAFYGWTAEQTIYVPFSEDNIPDGWEKAEVYPGQSWNYGCNATIIYAD